MIMLSFSFKYVSAAMPSKRASRATRAKKVVLPDVKLAEDVDEDDRQRQLQLFLSEISNKGNQYNEASFCL